MKTPGLEIFKMCSAIFVSSKFTEILENIYKMSIYLRNQTCLNIEYLRKFLRYKKGIYIYRPLYKTLVRITASFLYFICYLSNIRNQWRLLSRLSFPMFYETPCRKYNSEISVFFLISFFRWNLIIFLCF